MRPQSWIGLCILGLSLACARAQAPETEKKWIFDLPHGTLEIHVYVHADGRASIGILPSSRGLEAPIAEQVEPLKQVLAEIKGLGIDPRKLTYLGTRIVNMDVMQKLAYACVDSKDWRQSMRNKGKGKEELVVTLLNQSGAYEPYNEAFKDYGIRLRVTEAEKVSLIPFSEFPPRNDHDRANGRMLVAAHAALGMRFSPIEAQPEKK